MRWDVMWWNGSKKGDKSDEVTLLWQDRMKVGRKKERSSKDTGTLLARLPHCPPLISHWVSPSWCVCVCVYVCVHVCMCVCACVKKSKYTSINLPCTMLSCEHSTLVLLPDYLLFVLRITISCHIMWRDVPCYVTCHVMWRVMGTSHDTSQHILVLVPSPGSGSGMESSRDMDFHTSEMLPVCSVAALGLLLTMLTAAACCFSNLSLSLTRYGGRCRGD